jgi:putative phosphoribosyl transferase
VRLFADREEAGKRLGAHLAGRISERGDDVVVLGIPRGGVIVARPVADTLGAPLDILIPRKVGAPENPELAVAAVALAGGEQIVVRDEASLQYFQVPEDYVQREAARQRHEIARRQAAYRRGRAALPVAGRVAVLVDDGLATGLTARAALAALSRLGPKQTILAVPVAPPEAVDALAAEGVQVEVLEIPSPFRAVGRFYDSFLPVEDEEVIAALVSAAPGPPRPA